MDTQQLTIKTLDHHGVVAAMLKKLRIAERIDSLIPIVKDDRTKTTYGQRVSAMIINGLGFGSCLGHDPMMLQCGWRPWQIKA